jgi:hypothetical protein
LRFRARRAVRRGRMRRLWISWRSRLMESRRMLKVQVFEKSHDMTRGKRRKPQNALGYGARQNENVHGKALYRVKWASQSNLVVTKIQLRSSQYQRTHIQSHNLQHTSNQNTMPRPTPSNTPLFPYPPAMQPDIGCPNAPSRLPTAHPSPPVSTKHQHSSTTQSHLQTPLSFPRTQNQ